MSKKPSSKQNIFSEEYVKKNILHHYDLEDSTIGLIKFKDTQKHRAVYKISSKSAAFCLKKIYFNEDSLLFVYSALQWLWKKGIKTPILLNTKDGLKYVKHDGMIFILTPWVDGYKCDFDNLDHIILSVRQLAHIHNSSRSFFPIKGSEDRVGLNSYYISILKHFNHLLTSYNKAVSTKDKFSNIFLENFEDNLFLAKKSLEIASRIDDDELSKSICHGDYVSKNILFDNDNNIWVIDLDKCKYDYSIRDLGYFLRRLLRRDNTCFNLELALSLLREYNYHSKLTPSDLRYLVTYISFPQKFWKISKDYFKNIGKCNKSAFITLLMKSNEKLNFQIDFVKEIIPRIEKEYNITL
ncbi:MAG: CotS family spore coat protein [Clostridium sp.]|uniref:CotS family spore coat protein n=1 Tax=Clostridium TaxID=1485 RepID=UPI002152F7EA|nr:CotS family spore coat protein [Clostridium sp. LY3-2]MCR6513484.1 CotS family spore coat protein [Clostridium sp. LY3-2]